MLYIINFAAKYSQCSFIKRGNLFPLETPLLLHEIFPLQNVYFLGDLFVNS